jgi:hypothetical protein
MRHLLLQVADSHCQRFAGLGPVGFPLLWEIEQERMLERLLLFLDRECETGGVFLPSAFEVQFGANESELEPHEHAELFPNGLVRFQLDDGKEILLRGRIDRIDLSSDQQRARIIDYKTGKVFRGRFAGGAALQLPLYLYAACFLWPEHSWESAVYTYISHEHKTEEAMFTKENWESSLATLRTVVTKLTHGLWAGCFTPTPKECFPCPFPLICTSQVQRHALRKQHDPRLDALHQVRIIT